MIELTWIEEDERPSPMITEADRAKRKRDFLAALDIVLHGCGDTCCGCPIVGICERNAMIKEKRGRKNDLIVWLVGQPDDATIYEVKEKKEGRTLTQNAYYWTLLGKIAERLRMSRTECHNRMLREYGKPWLDEDDQITVKYKPDTEEAFEKMMRSDAYHLAQTTKTKTGKDGTVYRRWVLLLPSHLMNTEEMSVLVDGAVEEAKALGIETLPPYKLEEIRRRDEQKEREKQGDRDPDRSEVESFRA